MHLLLALRTRGEDRVGWKIDAAEGAGLPFRDHGHGFEVPGQPIGTELPEETGAGPQFVGLTEFFGGV